MKGHNSVPRDGLDKDSVVPFPPPLRWATCKPENIIFSIVQHGGWRVRPRRRRGKKGDRFKGSTLPKYHKHFPVLAEEQSERALATEQTSNVAFSLRISPLNQSPDVKASCRDHYQACLSDVV